MPFNTLPEAPQIIVALYVKLLVAKRIIENKYKLSESDERVQREISRQYL